MGSGSSLDIVHSATNTSVGTLAPCLLGLLVVGGLFIGGVSCAGNGGGVVVQEVVDITSTSFTGKISIWKAREAM